MKIIKNTLLIVVLSIISLCNGMEPERPKKVSWKKKVKNALLGKSYKPFNFVGLPLDIQNYIISLLSQYSKASSLKEAGQTIKALSQTNQDLNALINEPQFCYQLIRTLAKNFKVSDEYAAQMLGTKEAQRQYNLQKQLYSFVCDKKWDTFKNDIKEKLAEGADINFIYKSGKTLLMHAAKELDSELFNFLIEQGADINFANNKGETALIIAANIGAIWDSYSDFQKLFAAHQKDFNINQQDAQGNTVLMYVLVAQHEDIDVVKALLAAGADPELANFAGDTPLGYIEKGWETSDNKNEIITLLKQAIAKKHENK